MDWEIGEIRQIDGEWYQCVKDKSCNRCAFKDTKCGDISNIKGYCSAINRSDKKSVIFKKLEKIGTIYVENGKLYQKYKVFKPVYGINKDELNTVIAIEIKQEDMEKKNKNRYDGRMDEECIPLCDALNSLPGVETTSSCCGHCKNDFMIFFNCNNSYSLAVIARAFSRRYSGTFLAWKIEVETHDNGGYGYFMHSVKPYPTEFEMKTDVGQLIENLEVWKAEEYKEYFNYGGKEEALNRRSKIRGYIDTVKVSWEE